MKKTTTTKTTKKTTTTKKKTTRTTTRTTTTATTTNSEAVTSILLNVFRKAQKFTLHPDDGLHITEIFSYVFINKYYLY